MGADRALGSSDDEDGDDRAAILRVIEGETAAWLDRDFEAWAGFWVHEPYIRRLVSQAREGIRVVEGGEDNLALIRGLMQSCTPPGGPRPEVVRDNLNIRVTGDMAWATFEQRLPIAREDLPTHGHHLRILERHGGNWKIVCVVEMKTRLGVYRCPAVQVDSALSVLWMNKDARQRLGAHGSLQICGGRLCARDRESHGRLRAAVAGAAEEISKLRPHGVKQFDWPQNVAIPVFLERTDTGEQEICWVSTHDAMLMVLFDDDEAIDQRLAAAKDLYRLTPAQLRVAAEIAGGLDLRQAAERLGISATTARTHVSRMFEKTGVHSQPALVRTLLTVGSPGV
jgi:DNA-binding CsgD family transcriptional regulator